MTNEFGSNRMWGLETLPLPEPISWRPETVGWIGLAALALGLLAWIAWRRHRGWQRQRYRRVALAALASMARDTAALRELPRLLRATALEAFPREEVASLRGRDWIEWLNASGGRFDPHDAAWLERLPYDDDAPEAIPADVAARLLDASRAFLRSHRARV